MINIAIAGGTGFIGQLLETLLVSKGHRVFILTRSPTKENHVAWSVEKGTIDFERIKDTEILINLCGAGIGDKRWTKSRKEELLNSRVEPTQLLYKYFHQSNTLNQYITASGINCYPLKGNKTHKESDAFGEDFVSDLVQKWERSASVFEEVCRVYKLRLGVVLHPKFGALSKLMQLTSFGLASPLGSGNQLFTTVHYQDVIGFFNFIVEHPELETGAFNVCGDSLTNAEFMKLLAKEMNKPFFLPKIPAFLLKIVLGEMSSILLNGIDASNEKAKSVGFNFAFESQELAIKNLL
ncbi:MAG: TIGR01777 family oxidoreductase [Bacteroidetes bacterium]|nr:TIGR01777 family oxidoreductase [Bacteroidota bacterium]